MAGRTKKCEHYYSHGHALCAQKFSLMTLTGSEATPPPLEMPIFPNRCLT